MAWMFLIKGTAFKVNKPTPEVDPYDFTDDKSYKDLKSEAKNLGLELNAAKDEESKVVTFAVGKELLPGTQSYQGSVRILDNELTEEQVSQIDNLAAKLSLWINSSPSFAECGVTQIDNSIYLNHFD